MKLLRCLRRTVTGDKLDIEDRNLTATLFKSKGMALPMITPTTVNSGFTNNLSKADLEKLASCRPHEILEDEAMIWASRYGLCREVQESYRQLGSWEAALEEWDIL